MPEHFKEPLVANECGADEFFICEESPPGEPGEDTGWGKQIGEVDGKANAERLIDCANALVGVPDPAKLMSMLRTFVDNYEENYSEMNGEGITEFADIQNAMKGND